jgi:hypothetical protein
MNPIRTVVAVVAAAGALVAVPGAPAKEGDVLVRGTCTGASSAKLKLSPENGRIEVEFEVDQNRNRVPWRVTLRRNGNLVASFTARTRAPSGSFEIHRVIGDRPGLDRISARATRASGETCKAGSTAPRATAATGTTSDDGPGHDAGDDRGGHSGRHS